MKEQLKEKIHKKETAVWIDTATIQLVHEQRKRDRRSLKAQVEVLLLEAINARMRGGIA